MLDAQHRCRAGRWREESGARGKVRAEGIAGVGRCSSIMTALTDMGWGHIPASVGEGEEAELSPGPWTHAAALEPRPKQAVSQEKPGGGGEPRLGDRPGSPAGALLHLWLPWAPQACVCARFHLPRYERHHRDLPSLEVIIKLAPASR